MAQAKMKDSEVDPRGRWHVLSQEVARQHRGEVVVIRQWPIGKKMASVVASDEDPRYAIQQAKVKFGRDIGIVAHSMPESRIPWILKICKPAERRERRR
ncbi:TPA: hypothetical protein DDX30_04700 [Candidatus Wolfebacteria bacterium]|nr:hypothetical protein [Candidatus Wolfebacteria bacterium]